MRGFVNLSAFIVFWVVILAPHAAHAIQTHGGGEGLIVHQLAHVVFGVSMAGMAMRIRKSPLAGKCSWKALSSGAWFFVFWNIWAFIGHTLEIFVPRERFIAADSGVFPSFAIETWIDLAYFIYKMDHVILVPGMTLFFLGLRWMEQDFRRDGHPS